MLRILPEGWPHKSFKIRKTNVGVFRKKLSLLSPPKPIEEQKPWPPPEWDNKFKEMISHYTDVFMDKLSKDETIFAPTEPTKLKPDTKPYHAKRAKRSPLHYKHRQSIEKTDKGRCTKESTTRSKIHLNLPHVENASIY